MVLFTDLISPLFCVEKFGTERMEDLSKEAIQKRLQQFRQLTQFEIEIA